MAYPEPNPLARRAPSTPDPQWWGAVDPTCWGAAISPHGWWCGVGQDSEWVPAFSKPAFSAASAVRNQTSATVWP